MRARAFSRRDPVDLVMRHRLVYRTKVPGIYTVIGRDGLQRYRVALMSRTTQETMDLISRGELPAVCDCPAGHLPVVCWHALLVVIRKGGLDGATRAAAQAKLATQHSAAPVNSAAALRPASAAGRSAGQRFGV